MPDPYQIHITIENLKVNPNDRFPHSHQPQWSSYNQFGTRMYTRLADYGIETFRDTPDHVDTRPDLCKRCRLQVRLNTRTHIHTLSG